MGWGIDSLGEGKVVFGLEFKEKLHNELICARFFCASRGGAGSGALGAAGGAGGDAGTS